MEFYLPHITGAGHYDSSGSFREVEITSPRELNHFEIELFTRDGGTAFINGVGNNIKKGNILIARSGDIRFSKLHFCCLFVHFDTLDRQLSEILNSLPRFVSADCTQQLNSLFYSIGDSFLCGNACSGLESKAALVQLVCKIKSICEGIGDFSSTFTNDDEADAHNINKAPKYMKQHLEADVDIPFFASLCNLSQSAFYDKFKASLKTTPKAYLNSLRIAKAKRELIQTDKPLDIVAQSCGFSSQAYFTYVFKKQVGVPPLKYRNSTKYKL